MLKTERLVLRALGPDDVPWIVAGVGEFAVARWLSAVPHPYTEADARAFVADDPAGPGVWAITEGGVPRGVVSARDEMGCWLARGAWGRGLATEAARAVAAAWFAAGGGDLPSNHKDGNAASRRVLVKLGFADVGPRVIASRSLGRDVPGRAMRPDRAAAEWSGLLDPPAAGECGGGGSGGGTRGPDRGPDAAMPSVLPQGNAPGPTAAGRAATTGSPS